MAKPMRILVAEDSWVDLYLLKESLQEHLRDQFELVECRDGEQMFKFINRVDSGCELDCPDLIVMDLHLPKWEGTDILARIRSSPRLRDTPVAILSGYDELYGRRIARSFEPCHYFRKAGSLSEFMSIGGALKQFAVENQSA
ncbi:MAG TPA: response regulator [Bryobacteraceae bacterium]|jgi:CheY-like chemotaxis protein|nr:response regulator [Bryobacteraceae bacterium]